MLQIILSDVRINSQRNFIKTFLIPLDIFHKNLHNKGVQYKLDAWLTFLSSDDPDDIISAIEKYLELKAMYEHVYYLCKNANSGSSEHGFQYKLITDSALN